MNDQGQAPAGGVRHAGLLYEGVDEFASAAGHFVDAGVRAGEAVFAAATGSALGLLRARLGARGSAVTWADLSLIGANPRRVMALMREFAESHRGQPVRFARQAGWLSRPQGELQEAMRHEPLFNLASGPVQVLCGYDVRLGGKVAGCAERAHPMLVGNGRWQANRLYAGPGTLPGQCDQPLASPPATAAVLGFRDDLAGVRQVVADQARLAGLDPQRVGDLVLAVSELAANTLAHAGGPGTLTVWCTQDEIICQIHDSGHISDPLAGSLRPTPDSALQRGFGIWIVNQVCDLVETRTAPGGTTTRLHMRLGSAPSHRPGPVPAGGGADHPGSRDPAGGA